MNENPNTKLRFGLWYDFRNPPQWRRPYTHIYNETLEQIAWAEQNGFDDVWLQEHHFHEDGFSPSVLPIAAAIEERTKRIHIGTAVMLLPFHNPVLVAEDGATIDIISNGRFQLGVGIGYKVEEFESFGIPRSERGGRANEGLEIIRRLWEGETLTFKGKYYEVNSAKLAPELSRNPGRLFGLEGLVPPVSGVPQSTEMDSWALGRSRIYTNNISLSYRTWASRQPTCGSPAGTSG
jgi:Coenzyme F420-dependent N5,N10-methylene tetrahydromethanopterin reductase and related flavin-dependent oxidoreductases